MMPSVLQGKIVCVLCPCLVVPFKFDVSFVMVSVCSSDVLTF